MSQLMANLFSFRFFLIFLSVAIGSCVSIQANKSCGVFALGSMGQYVVRCRNFSTCRDVFSNNLL